MSMPKWKALPPCVADAGVVEECPHRVLAVEGLDGPTVRPGAAAVRDGRANEPQLGLVETPPSCLVPADAVVAPFPERPVRRSRRAAARIVRARTEVKRTALRS